MVFIAGALFLVVALGCVMAVEELPLLGPVRVPDPAADEPSASEL
jgi:hypothetical protein